LKVYMIAIFIFIIVTLDSKWYSIAP